MIILATVVVALIALYFYGTRTFKYWENRGIKHEKPIPFIGNNADFILMRKSITQTATDIYWRYPNEKVVGYYRAMRPELVIRDPEIAKHIITTDFSHFYRRGLYPHKKVVEPILRNLLFAEGDLWRLLRKCLTPAFSSGKLKAMFPLISERAERLQEILAADTSGTRTIDARDIMARYSTDFIASCGFGLQCDSLSEEHSAFRKFGAKITDINFPMFIRYSLKELFPELCKHLRIMSGVEDELIGLVKEMQKQKNYEPSGRNDFIDLLLVCKKMGTIVGESIEKVKPDGTPEIATLEMDDIMMAAQIFVLFSAGFETSSSSTSYVLHELAYHPDVQRKVQHDIDRVLTKYKNKISYEAIKEMTYLEWAFYEGMRMFTPGGFLIRQCTQKYTIKEINITIDPGVNVVIPVQAIHSDPQYFDNPEEFRPERFHPDVLNTKHKFTYLPFGEGPRSCLGARLGLMQSLAGLAAVLSKYSVEPAPETLRHPVVDPKYVIVQRFKGGLPLIFRERKKYH